MRDSFITKKFVLDLSKVQTSYMEENPRFSDTFFTKYSLPFEFHIDRDIRSRIGHYDSLNAIGAEKVWNGYHIFEGKIKEGRLEILEVEGDIVRAQIDSGFEELPSFEKKLSELPLEKVHVDNIYKHAQDIYLKSYPETNYNFPRVIYNKHQPTEAGWEIFNQFLNDMNDNGFIDNNEDGSDWNEKTVNEREESDQFHKNRNIIHPMPYLMHVLKAGFKASGYSLSGDILEDKDFQHKVIFHPNANYFTGNQAESIVVKMKTDEDIVEEYSLHQSYAVVTYNKIITLKKGKYLLQGTVDLYNTIPLIEQRVDVLLDGKKIFHKGYYKGAMSNLFIPFDVNDSVSFLAIKIQKFIKKTDIEDFANITIDLRENVNNDGSKIKLINNRNSFSLAEFVPDMTFGDFLRIICNWKNYDINVEGKEIVMNSLKTENFKKMKSIKDFEIPNPVKTFTKKKSFNIQFPEISTVNNALIDAGGVTLNGTTSDATTEIKINGYSLPVESYKGVATVAIKSEDESILGLIDYPGPFNNSNLAQNVGGLMLPDILSVLEPWYSMRIFNNEYRWSFFANKNKWRDIQIKDTLYAYGRKVWIREINKTVIDEKNYKIDIVVEVVK